MKACNFLTLSYKNGTFARIKINDSIPESLIKEAYITLSEVKGKIKDGDIISLSKPNPELGLYITGHDIPDISTNPVYHETFQSLIDDMLKYSVKNAFVYSEQYDTWLTISL